jgi:hypothetical protein
VSPVTVAHGDTVTLLRTEVAGRDRYGNDILQTTGTDIPGVAVWPRGARANGEDTNARDQVIIGITALIPPGVTVASTDRIRWRGNEYEVDGEPGMWRSYLTGFEGGTEVALLRVTG